MFKSHINYIKILVYSILLVFFYLLQSVPSFHLRFFGCSPELILVLVVTIAFFESESFAAFFGLAAGLISDCVTNTVFGASALFFMFAAFFVSVLVQLYFRRFFIPFIYIVLATLVLYTLTTFLFNLALWPETDFLTSLIRIILPKILLSGIWAYPIYFIISRLEQRLSPGGDNS